VDQLLLHIIYNGIRTQIKETGLMLLDFPLHLLELNTYSQQMFNQAKDISSE